jgi:hypothetical protein
VQGRHSCETGWTMESESALQDGLHWESKKEELQGRNELSSEVRPQRGWVACVLFW